MHVIGTAGHVDHGKSTLVEALTGTHPDRLQEEQKREMTIDLGFAWTTLLNGDEIGIVDVPGHRDFIENMLAGIGGIDAVLFVVAADEGVMPQTREHLAILDLLQIPAGVIALTKIDLVEGPEWIEMVSNDLRLFFAGTKLTNAPIIPVSARKKIGIQEIKKALGDVLEQVPPRKETGKPRLPIDRVFKISGFGTVVTGTLLNGKLTVGEEIQIQPTGLKGKIRGLQTHQIKEHEAFAGSRTAVNISGLDSDLIKRGDVLTLPDQYESTRLLDVQIRILKDASKSLTHHAEVKLFLGAAEVIARTRLLGIDLIKPGEVGWVQLELNSPVIAAKGDRFILRIPSPGETFGGGEVIDPLPHKRHKRFDPPVIEQLVLGLKNRPEDEILRISNEMGVMTLVDLESRLQDNSRDWNPIVHKLVKEGALIVLEGEIISQGRPEEWLFITPTYLRNIKNKLARLLLTYHHQYPLKTGMPKEEVKSKLGWSSKEYQFLIRELVKSGALKNNKSTLSMPDFCVRFTARQEKMLKQLMISFDQSPYTPPGVKTCQEEVGKDVYQALIEQGILIEVSPEVDFRSKEYQIMLEKISRESEITVAQFRDIFQTSRKYALAFLENMDAAGITVRSGDIHKLKKTKG